MKKSESLRTRDENVPRSQIKKQRARKIEGDAIWYFFLHNFYSALLFAVVGFSLGIFAYEFLTLLEIFSWVFFDVVFQVVLIMVFTGLVGRFFAYLTLKAIFDWKLHRAMKSIGTLNSGINKIVSWTYIISVALTAFIFTLGIFPIIQFEIFGKDTFTTIVWTFLVLKISIFVAVRIFAGFKL